MSDNPRGSRGLIVGSLAGGVLIVLALIIFGPASTNSNDSADSAVSSRLLDEKIPERDPGQRVVISQDEAQGADPFASLQTGRGELEFTNEDGSLALRYRWDRSTPLKGGWNEFEAPRAWVYQSPQRLIYVTADQGRFQVAENRQPQAGVLNGNVVVSMFEVHNPGQTVYAIDPTTTLPGAQFETTSMDFDLLRMLARTDSRVMMRTANVVLAGTGMELLFNESQGRIETLEIRRREIIAYRINRKKTAPDQSDGGALSDAAEPDLATATTPPTAAPADPTTTYELVLSDEVIIEQGPPDNHTTIAGRELVAYFTAGKADFEKRMARADRNWRLPSHLPAWTQFQRPHAPVAPSSDSLTLEAWLAASIISAAPSSDHRFLGDDGDVADDDVVVTGMGSLLLTPLNKPMDRLTEPDDVFAVLSGSPVHILNGDAYALGDAIEYSRSAGTAKLMATRDQPLEAGLADGARLTSVSPFTYFIDQGRGTLIGGGTLVGLENQTTDPPDDASQEPERKTSADSGLPTGFLVSWLEEFGVEFEPTDGGGLGRIAAATFNGSVHVDDPAGYSLDSGNLRIGFREDETTLKSELDTVTATKDAKLLSADGNVFGDELFVQFKPDAHGRSIPEQLTVTGNGRMETDDGTLESQYIQADLVERSLALAEAMTHDLPGSEDFVLKRLIAQGSVLMSFADGVSASAERLVADTVTDLTTLTGQSVVVADPSMKLIGKHIVINYLFDRTIGRVARVIGPGTMTYWELGDRAELAGDQAPAPASSTDDRPRQAEQPLDQPFMESPGESSPPDAKEINVNWNGGLVFDEAPGVATFTGNIKAVSKPTPLETDTLTGDWMKIELTGPLDRPATTNSDPATTSLDRNKARKLRKLTLIGQGENLARFDAVRYTDESKTDRELLVALGSEIIEYTAPTEFFQALGPGWMLIVDGRPESAEPNKDSVEFSGPGETEFTWAKDMTLDGTRSRLTFNEEVVMRHRPIGEPVMRMDCHTLEALFLQTERTGIYDLSSRSSLELARAIASGTVFIKREDRNIWCDRATFDRADELATLEAQSDSSVVIETESTGGVVYARSAQWNLSDDTVQAEALRADAPAPIINQP